MRSIKFRIWDVSCKRWAKEHNPVVPVSVEGGFLDISNRSESHFEFSEFTGLHDKNGKEIYEGDILLSSRYRTKQVVVWNEPKAGFATEGGTIMYELGRDDDDEVIGNVYENEELLTK